MYTQDSSYIAGHPLHSAQLLLLPTYGTSLAVHSIYSATVMLSAAIVLTTDCI